MAVGSSFDLWQKDVFFSAAEEVQESTDVMESVYRMWLRERNEKHKPDVLDELRRELQTALGTAKWQLEEFERAVRKSHENSPSEKNVITRHTQFVAAIENQIFNVEKTLGDSLIKEGKQPLRWVQLDEEERDDLALFLSVTPQSSHQNTDIGNSGDADSSGGKSLPNSVNSFREAVTFNGDAKYVVELEAKEVSRTEDVTCSQGEQKNGQRRTWSSPDIGAWKIVITDEENEERKPLETRTEPPARAYNFFSFMKKTELTAKAKWLRNNFGKVKSRDHTFRQGISSYLDFKGVTRVSQRLNVLSERGRSCLSNCQEEAKISNLVESQHHALGHYMQIKKSLWFSLLLGISMLLVVPFVLYST